MCADEFYAIKGDLLLLIPPDGHEWANKRNPNESDVLIYSRIRMRRKRDDAVGGGRGRGIKRTKDNFE